MGGINFPGRIAYEDEWQVAAYGDNAQGRICELSAEHVPIYAEVIRASFATVARDFNLTRENCPRHTSFITNEELAGKYSAVGGYCPYGCFADGKLAGFAALTGAGGGTYELNNVAVLPGCRHLGYGKALLDYGKEKAAKLGGNKITIAIIEENAVLKKWYAANGFAHTGTKRFEHMPFTVGYMEWNLGALGATERQMEIVRL